MENDLSRTARSPAPDAIAAFVKLQRELFGWKQNTLASLAGVSLSTVQRVERGETIRPSQLTKLAVALKRPADAFTRQIVPLTPAEAMEALKRDASWMEGKVPVTVAPLRKEAQVRQLAQTELCALDSDMGEEVIGAMEELREWFDLASFIRAEQNGLIENNPKTPVRPFYRSLLASVHRIEIEHRAVCLAGTYNAIVLGDYGGTARVAVLALRSRDRNPAAGNIRTLWGEGAVDFQAAIRSWMDQMP